MSVKTIKIIPIILFIFLGIALSGCRSTRHVPQGDLLLDDIRININDSTHTLKDSELKAYLKQLPNHKMFWSVKFRLGIYNMSGNDTTKWYNRWVRKLGEKPVIYDSLLTVEGVRQLLLALNNQGFLEAKVTADEIIDEKKRKIKVRYNLNAGSPHIIESVDYVIPDKRIREIVMRDSSKFLLRRGDRLDVNKLDSQRDFLTSLLRDHGYYGFSKEYITFNADTTAGSKDVELTMKISIPESNSNNEFANVYTVRNVNFILDFNPSAETDNDSLTKGMQQQYYKGINFYYEKKEYLRPSVLYENCFIRPGGEYRQSEVNRTYQSLSRLNILKFINIKFIPVKDSGGLNLLDAYVLLTPGKSQSVSFELEGTNSEGDLGVAAAVSYTHRNVGKGSETLTAKARGAYESLSGNFEGFINNRFMEYSLDLGVTFPKFKAPFLTENFKRKINASTGLNVSMSYQERPEYTRIISNIGWSYRWIHNRNNNSFVYSPIDINYVYLPRSTYDFIDQIAPDNPLLRYSYEDHFIMMAGFTYYHSNKKKINPSALSFQNNIYTLWANIELAGNLLYILNEIFRPRKNIGEDPYKIFGIHYSQYFRINSEWAFLHIFDYKNSLALRVGFGLGYPYGNSTILPFEKRFYGGGANGVRGWDVRTLGPGSYPNSNSVSDFINQCGDIRLILSAEYRAKLFWVLELAAFIDAGNIWTIKNYPNQPGGLFYFNEFYKQLAASYGLGLRLDFNYFLLRFDVGMKAHNPASGAIAWPLVHPNWHRDSSFHFSIGYPF